MDPKVLFAKAVEQASPCIRRLEADQLSDPTPCSEWDLRALLNHMVYELRWVPDILRGKTVQEVGAAYDGDLLGTNPVSAWQHAADGALVAIKRADPDMTVHLSYGDVAAKEYIAEIGRDMLIHGWDVGQAMHCTIMFDKDMAEAIYNEMLPRREEFVNSRAFGEPIEVNEDADIQTKLLALYGRSPAWQGALLA
jgi:uncharacterized protein (TIGR03086 family)